MDSISRIHQTSTPLNLSTHLRPSFSNPKPSSLSFFPLCSNSKPYTKPLKSSSLPPPPPPPLKTQTPIPRPHNPFSSFLKTTAITLITTTLCLSRFTNPSVAAPVSQPTVESTKTETSVESDEEKERELDEYLESHPDDIQGLKNLMGIKLKARKFNEAIGIIDRLIEIEPLEKEWPLLKAHVFSYGGDIESAKLGFEEILSKNELLVEAYHGLIMAAAQSEVGELEDVMKRIEGAMEKCKKEKKKEDLRDFKLLVAQVRVVEGKYTDALKVYQELVKEEPRDFRPYLCQGIIYTLLKKQDEADKQFQKYRRLVPQGHPYARYFEDNMIATKLFSQMGDNQKMGVKN